MPNIILPDGKKLSFKDKVTGLEIASKISKSLSKQALIMSVNGDLKDLSHEITKDSKVRIITPKDKELALKLIDQDIAEMNSVSERWQYDMQSDSWLSKNTRPLTLIYLTVCMTLFIVFDSIDLLFEMNAAWIDLLQTLLVTVYVAYFGSRGAEKVFINKNKQ